MMKDTINETYDVIVVGAGPSGIAAAVCAAKNGAVTLLIDQSTLVGGIASRCYVNTFRGSANGLINNEIKDLITRAWDFSIINQEKLIDRYYQLLSEYGVTVLCGTQVTSLIKDDNCIVALEISQSAHKQRIKTPIVIDATGGVLCNMLNPDTEEVERKRFSITALVGRIESVGGRCYSLEARQLLSDRINHAREQSKINESVHVDIKPTVRGDMALVDVSIKMDSNDYAICRSALFEAVNHLQSFGYGFENAHVMLTSKDLYLTYPTGSEAQYRISKDDIQSGHIFSDWVVSGCCFEKLSKEREKDSLEPFCIPYGSLVHANLDNLLLCGRSIGMTTEATPFVDGIPIHHASGQSAGTAAALCIAEKCKPEALPIHKLQEVLVLQQMPAPVDQLEVQTLPIEEDKEEDVYPENGDLLNIDDFSKEAFKDQRESTESEIEEKIEKVSNKERNAKIELDLQRIEKLLLTALYGEDKKKENDDQLPQANNHSKTINNNKYKNKHIKGSMNDYRIDAKEDFMIPAVFPIKKRKANIKLDDSVSEKTELKQTITKDNENKIKTYHPEISDQSKIKPKIKFVDKEVIRKKEKENKKNLDREQKKEEVKKKPKFFSENQLPLKELNKMQQKKNVFDEQQQEIIRQENIEAVVSKQDKPVFEKIEKPTIPAKSVPEEDMVVTLFIPEDEDIEELAEMVESVTEQESKSRQTPTTSLDDTQKPVPRTLDIPDAGVIDDVNEEIYGEDIKNNAFDEEQVIIKHKDKDKDKDIRTDDAFEEFRSLLDMLPDQLPEDDYWES